MKSIARWALVALLAASMALAGASLALSLEASERAAGLFRSVKAQQEALLGFESARRADMAEVRGMVDYLGTDVDVCHKRAAITLWLVEQVAKTQRGRERIPALPEDWPERPEGGE